MKANFVKHCSDDRGNITATTGAGGNSPARHARPAPHGAGFFSTVYRSTRRPMTPASMAGIVLALLGLLFAPLSQAFADDEARRAILELRAQIRQMTEQNQQARLQLADQLDMLHQEVARLRGQLEELRPRSAAGGSPNAPQSAQANDPIEQAAYEAAADLYRGGRYKEAAEGFSSFVQSYPDSTIVGDAMFYLGSSQYASKDFSGSIQTLLELVKNRPSDPRSPDALLVVAADQIELNDLKSAKATLQRIINDYPDSTAAETAKSRMKLL